ncbi:hypothetical protein D9758_007122 [Tetrapyrgos nigripes]|uniref:Uncharacterized protein n=1 Tax=Tetrapyrgos nigripes TaxID=182062 RepID=A0A8H5GDV7_9AGAR|nr:hypothetical protein D9758_007122 [Tetrapyrgos nigripes]
MSFDFSQTKKCTFSFNNSSMNIVGGNVNNYYYGPPPNIHTLLDPEDDFRTIRRGDIKLLQLVWSGNVEVERSGYDISKLKQSNPFRVFLQDRKCLQQVKVVKRIYNAELTGYGDQRFTVATFHTDSLQSESGHDEEKQQAWQREYGYWASRKDAYTLQLFGLCPRFPALIYHDGLVIGSDMFGRYENRPIIFCYLQNRWAISFNNVYTFSREMCRISRDTDQWWFNPQTDTFQCDPTLILYSESECSLSPKRIPDDVYALKVDSASETTVSFDNRPVLLNSQNRSGLGVDPSVQTTIKIVNHLCNFLPDYLWSISDMCWARGVGEACGLKSYAPHGLLTFGSVVIKDQPSIYAYFPSTPTPTWIFHMSSSSWPDGVQVETGKSGVSFTFHGYTKGELDLRFSLELPPQHRDKIRVAFLSQSLLLRDDFSIERDPSEFVLVDYIRLRLQTKLDTYFGQTVHLFIPAWNIDAVNGLPCVKWPPEPMFLWSCSSRKYAPKMKVRAYIGTFWFRHHYAAVKEYLELQEYDLRGFQYTKQRGCEVLKFGDPHMNGV